MQDETEAFGVVIIGRNEGARLIACLNSIAKAGRRIVYVDSGSKDASQAAAKEFGAEFVALDMSAPFTAARARNAGFAKLIEGGAPEFVQFVDGDCEIVEGWLETAAASLRGHPKTAVVCGRRREKFPERTIYNRLVDREWETPVGETKACGGDAMMRASAFEAVGGFREELIAGEEPELCVRLRAAGWKIRRLAAEMTRHDIDIAALGQWLKRARRAGHAFAEVSCLHRGEAEQIWLRETRRALLWTGLGAASMVAGLFWGRLFLLVLLAFPVQIARIALKDEPTKRESWVYATLIMLQKPWEAAGAVQYWLGRALKRSSTVIEYKDASVRENSR